MDRRVRESSVAANGQCGLADGSAVPAGLIDVPYPRELGSSWNDLFAVGLVMSCPAVAISALRTWLGLTAAVTVGIVVLLGGIVCFTYIWKWSVRARAREQARATSERGLAPVVSRVAEAIRGLGAPDGLAELGRSLLEQGRGGLTIRLAPPNALGSIAPLVTPFEPQPLNEVLSTLVGENAGMTSVPGTTPGADPASVDIRTGTRSIRRNVLLKGGWVVLAVLAFNWVWALVDCIGERHLTWRLLLWSLSVVLLLFAPADGRLTQQWYVVPGALVRRTARLWQSCWKLHLFTRRESILFVFRYSRQRWAACVVDGQSHGHVAGTREEMEFLLRAWLSPIAPPSVERFSDLE